MIHVCMLHVPADRSLISRTREQPVTNISHIPLWQMCVCYVCADILQCFPQTGTSHAILKSDKNVTRVLHFVTKAKINQIN